MQRTEVNDLNRMQVRRIKEHFAVLCPDQHVDTIALRPELYAELSADYGDFRGHALVAWHEFTSDWASWECHPAGDELVLLLSGAATMVVRDGGKDRELSLTETGDYCIVPAGLWHTARVRESAIMLFITPGAGTVNRERPPTMAR